MKGALEGVRVLDLTQGIAGPFGVKLLADQGADVVKIERPGGEPMRGAGPFPGDEPHPEKSGLFLYLNTNKRGLTLDLRDAADLARFHALVARADLVVESYRPRTAESLGLTFEDLCPLNPALSLISLSNFGDWGPHRDWELTDLVNFALSGPMAQTGLPDREPLRYAEHATLGFAGLALANAALAALITSHRTGRGHHVELSVAEAFLAGGQRQTQSYFYCGHIPGRSGDPLLSQFLVGAYPCKDGYVAVQGVGRGESWWPRVFAMMGQPELSDDPRFSDGAAIALNKPALDEIWLQWLSEHTRAEVFDRA
ncbi:MAG: CoA transferase, partial [Dechloromonas sp.]|nr:CoA transferase [Dechloromonas sp.]